MEACAVHLPRHARPRLSESLDADRTSKRVRFDEFPAWHRERRQLVYGPAAIYVGSRLHPRRSYARCWTAHVVKMYEIMLMRKAKSWFTGYNSNVAGHEEGTVRYFVYNGGTPKFLGIINEVAAKGYREIAFGAGASGDVQAS